MFNILETFYCFFLAEVLKQLQVVNEKLDIILRYLTQNSNNSSTPVITNTIEVQTSNLDQLITADQQPTSNEGVILEGFPPSYSMIQAAKEQQQQEYYALTLSSRQAQQLFRGESEVLNTSTNDEVKQHQPQKAKLVDISQYLTQISALAGQQQQHQQQAEVQINPQEQNIVEDTIAGIPTILIDKVFVESRSRANFAKNLTFAIFSPEERRGRNCTGRVFGKAQHKEQLDQVKLQAVKEVTFRKYPCSPYLIDITWKKECITAIDSGLRNENRGNRTQVIITQEVANNIQKSDEINVVETVKNTSNQ